MIEFNCPHCGNSMKVNEAAAGKKGNCKKCGESVRVPSPQIVDAAEVVPEIPSMPVQVDSSNHPTTVLNVPPTQYPQAVQVVVNAPAPRWNAGIAALLSFLFPGLGQVYKGQVLNGLVWAILTIFGYFCFIFPGVVLHLFCILGAAMGDPYR